MLSFPKMEDDNGLELSLGLSCGGSAGKLKDKDGSSSDAKSEEGINNKLGGDLKNFLNTGIHKQDTGDGSQRKDLAQAGLQTPPENFFTNLAKSAPLGDASVEVHGINNPSFTRHGGIWDANTKSADVEEVKSSHNDIGKWLEPGNKRKMFFEDMNHQKKPEREAKHADAHGKGPSMVLTSLRTSHISVTTEDGSTAENEDVAESEVEGSTSRLVLHHDDATKHYVASSGGGSEVIKQSHVQKQSSHVPPRNEPKLGNLTFGSQLPPMSEPYSLSSKGSNGNGESNTSGFPMSSVMQLMPHKKNEGSGSQNMNPGNLALNFGYPSVQLPTLDPDRSWGSMPLSQQLTPSLAGRSIGSAVPSSDRLEDALKLSQGAPSHCLAEADERKTCDLTKGAGKKPATEEGGASSFSQVEGNRSIPIEGYYDHSLLENFPREGSTIRPGIAGHVKIGGSGVVPDLPWVSTTGPGPNGRTISGVTYRTDTNQLMIVCACHGAHMTTDGFVQHAGGDPQNPENNSGLPSFGNGNPAASARH